MIKEFYGRIKVDKKIKPLKNIERVSPQLIVGNDYYVSFMYNNTYPCRLIEIINEFNEVEVKIAIPVKLKSKRGFIDIDGNLSFRPSQLNIVKATEIGLTPEDAVKNQVH